MGLLAAFHSRHSQAAADGGVCKVASDVLTPAHEEAYKRASSMPKTALVDDTLHETEEDARKRRLGELLRRRRPPGLDTGSATPNPPRDNT